MTKPFPPRFLSCLAALALGCAAAGAAGCDRGAKEAAPSGPLSSESAPREGPPVPLTQAMPAADALTEQDVLGYLEVRRKAGEIARAKKDAADPLTEAVRAIGRDAAQDRRVARIIQQVMENQVRRSMSGFAREAMGEQRRMVQERVNQARDGEARKQAEDELAAIDEGIRRIEAQTAQPAGIEAKNLEIILQHKEEFTRLRQMEVKGDPGANPRSVRPNSSRRR